MLPRLHFCSVGRSLAVRIRPSIGFRTPVQLRIASRRSFAEEKAPSPATSPNRDILARSEETADIGRVTGGIQPDNERGAPVNEILGQDEGGKVKVPRVLREEIEEGDTENSSFENDLVAIAQKVAATEVESVEDVEGPGHKFGLPTLPIPSTSNIKHRYDPIVAQVTGLLMRHGKLSVAQRNMSYILNHLRTSPPPVTNPNRPLLPGSPPAYHLPLNPILYLTLAIDSVAPLLRMRNQKGAAGGGQALHIPVPLGLRQRRRTAIKWILDAASKKPSRGSGRKQLAQRVAEEIISVVEGRSSAWEKRALLHKTGTSNRMNATYFERRKRSF